MVRTQIQLTEEQASALKAMALTRGVSMAELVRHAVDNLLLESRGPSYEERVERARAIAGEFRSGVPDLGARHDYYLYEDRSGDDLR